MKKFAKISAVLAALFFAFSFSGCSDDGSSSDDVTVDGSSSSGSSSSDGSSSGGSSSGKGDSSGSGSSSSSGTETGGSSGGSSSSGSGSGSSSGSGSGSSSSGSSSGSESGSGSSSSSSGDSGNSGSTGTGGTSSSGSGSGSESENVSLKGTYWTRVKDNKEGGEYLYFTGDTTADSYEYFDEGDVSDGESDKTGYALCGKWTFSVKGNVLTGLTYCERYYKKGKWQEKTITLGTGYTAAMTVSSSTAVLILTSSDNGTEAMNFRKVASAPTGETRK